MRNLLSYAFIFMIIPLAYSQEVKYDNDFRFTDGLFLDFEQVKKNDPIRKFSILTSAGYHDNDFFERVLESDVIHYMDEADKRMETGKENIWGYSRKGVLYIASNGDFVRLSVVGGICHFVSTITSTDTRYADPYSPYYYNNYYGGGYNNYYNYNNYYSPMQATTYKRTDLKQYILDFETGKVMEYDETSLLVALMRDPELHDEYARLGHKKQKQMKFLYIRKFNDRNPLYFNK